MEPLTLALLGALAFAVAALVAAERARSQRGIWAAKPLASATFLAMALPFGDPWLFGALALSFVGDLFLIPKDKRLFRVGILVFLLAHVAFAVAFVLRATEWTRAGIAVVPLALALVVVARWILPKVPRELKGAVVAYMLVISVMVALAAATTPVLLAAALAFYANDILVARDRFVAPAWWHRAVGLPLYYGAMAAFALVTRAGT